MILAASGGIAAALTTAAHTEIYHAAVMFYGLYPFTMALIWVTLATVYYRRKEIDPSVLSPGDYWPMVSIVIPAFEEEGTISRTLDAALKIDYPNFEVVVINDGSGDETATVVRRYLASGLIRLVDKVNNEGKAMALNDAIPACRGEIIVIVDSDVIPASDVLRALTPHFFSARVGAVTGNPRVGNRGSLLRDLQSLEFTAIISMQRRAQRVWGRVLTGSGAIMAVRKSALLQVGSFSPSMATEDIDLTWKLQLALWDVRYEPSAVVWMEVPPSIGGLWAQRRRWVRGLTQVLRRHRRCLVTWEQRRMWPIYVEAVLSILWAYTFVLMSLFWIACLAAGSTALGASPIPNLWGMLIATACLVRLFAGAMMDRRYDPGLLRFFPIAIFYPLVYWMLMSLITAIYTIDALVRKPPATQRWKIERA